MLFTFQTRCKSWMPAVRLCLPVLVMFSLGPPASSMDVLVAHQLNALNGTTVKLSCTFTSCYKVDNGKFAMNWTYQETVNDTEEMFMTYKQRFTPLRTEKFEDRVEFVGNLNRNDVSVSISDVQPSDEGVYNCFVRNPPDRVQGHGVINLVVVTEMPTPRDSTIAVAVGASVGGLLAVLILSMVLLKCLRRQGKQELVSDEQKMEEDKTEGEGGAEEGTKHAHSLPEDVHLSLLTPWSSEPSPEPCPPRSPVLAHNASVPAFLEPPPPSLSAASGLDGNVRGEANRRPGL